jgi:hypothetical protein
VTSKATNVLMGYGVAEQSRWWQCFGPRFVIDTNAFQFDHMVVSMFLKVESVEDGRRDLSGRAQVEMVRKCSTMGLRQACLTQPDTMGATYRSNHPTHKKR